MRKLTTVSWCTLSTPLVPSAVVVAFELCRGRGSGGCGGHGVCGGGGGSGGGGCLVVAV